MPFSIEYCSAPTAVMTEMTEKTPIVIPSMVRLERSLFAPNELQAILMVSLKLHRDLFVAERCHADPNARRLHAGAKPETSPVMTETIMLAMTRAEGKIDWE